MVHAIDPVRIINLPIALHRAKGMMLEDPTFYLVILMFWVSYQLDKIMGNIRKRLVSDTEKG